MFHNSLMSGRPRRGEGQALALRWEEGVLGDVARGPVPRECPVDRGVARDRPSPYVKGGLSAAAAPVGAPPSCIETGRALPPGRHRGLGT